MACYIEQVLPLHLIGIVTAGTAIIVIGVLAVAITLLRSRSEKAVQS